MILLFDSRLTILQKCEIRTEEDAFRVYVRGVYAGYAEDSGVYAEGSIWREVGVRGETSPEACYY